MKEFLTKERKVEDIILLVLSLIASVLGVLILSGKITIRLGDNISPKTFAWILLILGILAFVLSLYKIIKLNHKEGKK